MARDRRFGVKAMVTAVQKISLPPHRTSVQQAAWPAWNNLPPSAPSAPTSQSTARFRKRTSDPTRAPTTPKAKKEHNTKRQRTRRAVLGPLPGIGEKWPRTIRRRAPAMPKFHSCTSALRPIGCLRDHPCTRQTVRKGRFKLLLLCSDFYRPGVRSHLCQRPLKPARFHPPMKKNMHRQ